MSNQVGRNVVKRLNSCLPLAAVAVAAAFICGPANAARVFVGVGVGVPYYYPVAPVPYYYPYPYPPVVAVPAPPPVNYVEQGQAQGPGPSADGSGQQGGSWYYCDASKGYYPYVKDCPSGWRPVAPQPGNSQ
ncbi:hypothetical protein AWB69_01762 [Caballeronia udeis]|uniref:Lipoprotein n=1 Tax=Caballeronia udeis TaxID=1232866 RepID=A0A158FWS8_9BURK|nr:hypothetical protein AWB69_01762 [Caballeronia udeis]